MPCNIKNEWPEERTQRLITLWRDGWSMTAIGRDVGISKNSVSGKAHRLVRDGTLVARPSCIVRSYDEQKPRQPRRAGAITLPKLEPQQIASLRRRGAAQAPVRVVEQPTPRRIKEALCCYPIGDPGTKAFRYCDRPVTNYSTYCDECHRRCYTRPPRMAA